jgi:hypothetical protein
MHMAEKKGSETIGAAGDKGKMTLFRDDRQEDTGAIIVAAIVIAFLILTAPKKPVPPAPAPEAAPAAAPAAPAPAQK